MKEESAEPKIEIENHSSLPKAKLAEVIATAMAIMAKRQKRRDEEKPVHPAVRGMAMLQASAAASKRKDEAKGEEAGDDKGRDPNCARCRYDEFNLMVVPEFRESQARMMAKAIGPHKCGKKGEKACGDE